jgi:hypothetical protein
MDQDSVSSLAEQISWISQALEADETRVLMENLSASRSIVKESYQATKEQFEPAFERLAK